MSAIFEMLMVVLFGVSWPFSVYKSYTSKTTRGKSLFFEVFILLGYLCGIASKLISGTITYVFPFYVINALMVGADLFLYFRNARYEKARRENESA